MSDHRYDVLVIGAGQAGLTTGFHLQRSGARFLIVDMQAEPGGSWPRYYDSLRLFSPARYSSLPGMPFPGTPDHYPVRDEVVAYLRRYAHHFDRVVCVFLGCSSSPLMHPHRGTQGDDTDEDH